MDIIEEFGHIEQHKIRSLSTLINTTELNVPTVGKYLFYPISSTIINSSSMIVLIETYMMEQIMKYENISRQSLKTKIGNWASTHL